MMEKQTHVVLWKQIGETPRACLERFRTARSEYKDIPMTYAGRLDPMAEGLLLVLLGDECKRKETYTALSKTYETEVLCGVVTDTYDALGLIANEQDTVPTEEAIHDVVKGFVGKRTQKYPPFSSKTVAGKPLFAYAREGIIDKVEQPVREVEIFRIDILSCKKKSAEEIYEYVARTIGKVVGDFRQQEILEGWQEWCVKNHGAHFVIARLLVDCSSGTYVRALAHEFGEKIGVGALALSIKRTRVGNFVRSDVEGTCTL